MMANLKNILVLIVLWAAVVAPTLGMDKGERTDIVMMRVVDKGEQARLG